jgi:hypothetical protein
MGLDLWFREDVERILASTQETMSNSLGAVPPLDPQAAVAYQEGFADALRAVAIAFGLCPPGSPAQFRWTTAPLHRGDVMLDAGSSRSSALREMVEE